MEIDIDNPPLVVQHHIQKDVWACDRSPTRHCREHGVVYDDGFVWFNDIKGEHNSDISFKDASYRFYCLFLMEQEFSYFMADKGPCLSKDDCRQQVLYRKTFMYIARKILWDSRGSEFFHNTRGLFNKVWDDIKNYGNGDNLYFYE